jgi:acyl homoserine lactone synthase
MLRFLHARDFDHWPALQDSMFRDRARQFRDRLRWDVQVDARGWEIDRYDALNPLYVIWERPDGLHGGSMRLLPTTGQTMVNDHFLHLTDGVAFRSPFIWECTRFCLAPDADLRIAPALMAGGGEVMRAFHLSHYVGVFDAHMVRVYRRMGAIPDVLGTTGHGRSAIGVGLWSYSDDGHAEVLSRAGLSAALSAHWFDEAFGRPEPLRMTG